MPSPCQRDEWKKITFPRYIIIVQGIMAKGLHGDGDCDGWIVERLFLKKMIYHDEGKLLLS